MKRNPYALSHMYVAVYSDECMYKTIEPRRPVDEAVGKITLQPSFLDALFAVNETAKQAGFSIFGSYCTWRGGYALIPREQTWRYA